MFQNEHGNVEFAIKVIRDAKNSTQTPDKRFVLAPFYCELLILIGRPEHSFYEGLEPTPLFCQLMLFILAILVAKGAFRDYKIIEELFSLIPPSDEMCHLYWDEKVLHQPFFESMSGAGEIENATAYSGRFRDLGFRAGYAWPGTIHDFRALGLLLISTYTNSSFNSHAN